MNVTVRLDQNMPSDVTGGEYGLVSLDIYVDPDLPEETQRLLVIHSIIENYNRSMPHDKVDELCGLIDDALMQLGELDGS